MLNVAIIGFCLRLSVEAQLFEPVEGVWRGTGLVQPVHDITRMDHNGDEGDQLVPVDFTGRFTHQLREDFDEVLLVFTGTFPRFRLIRLVTTVDILNAVIHAFGPEDLASSN